MTLSDEQYKAIGDTINDLKSVNYSDAETARFILHRHGPTMIPLMYDEITRLRDALSGAATAANIAGAELKELREENERLRKCQYVTDKDWMEKCEEIQRLRKEREKLIDELRTIASMRGGNMGFLVGENHLALEALRSIGIDV